MLYFWLKTPSSTHVFMLFFPRKKAYSDAGIITRTKTSIDSNQEEEKRMRERKGEKVKIERVTFIYT